METESFILVGGLSSRFGRDKSGIEFGGRPLVERTAEAINNAISPSRITLVAANDKQLLGASGLTLSQPFIFDLYEGRGPVGGLHAALAYARTDWILVLACDLPFVTSELIGWLGDLISEDLDAVAPLQSDGRVQPLCAFYRVKPCLGLIEGSLLKNRPAPPMKAILDDVRTRFVAFEEFQNLSGSENFFLNINNPEDLAYAVEIERVKHAKPTPDFNSTDAMAK